MWASRDVSRVDPKASLVSVLMRAGASFDSSTASGPTRRQAHWWWAFCNCRRAELPRLADTDQPVGGCLDSRQLRGAVEV